MPCTPSAWSTPTAAAHWGRYSWEPEAGTEYLSEEQRDSADRDYLQEEIRDRLAEGIAHFTLEFTLANGR